MLHARYTFGYYVNPSIALLNLATISGFGIITVCSAVSGGQIDSTVGIATTGLIRMLVSFGSYRFLYQFERCSWIFALLAIVIRTGVGDNMLFNQAEVVPPPPATIVSYNRNVIAGFLNPVGCYGVRFLYLLQPIHFHLLHLCHHRGLCRRRNPRCSIRYCLLFRHSRGVHLSHRLFVTVKHFVLCNADPDFYVTKCWD
ncbi:hypothetical protein F5B21DRAFT_123447 [Xylaria acuta]|nr:hypothetical protein F5B21DRAFT_123447 [Xylaria acuta]